MPIQNHRIILLFNIVEIFNKLSNCFVIVTQSKDGWMDGWIWKLFKDCLQQSKTYSWPIIKSGFRVTKNKGHNKFGQNIINCCIFFLAYFLQKVRFEAPMRKYGIKSEQSLFLTHIHQADEELYKICYPPASKASRGVYWNLAQKNSTHPYTEYEYAWVSVTL